MKFRQILDQVAEAVPAYRRLIFSTIVAGLLTGKGGGTIAGIFRDFSALFTGTAVTRKRFYMFLNSKMVNWTGIWSRVADLIREHVAVAGRLLIALDDTTYGKTGRKIHGCGTHFDHAAKINVSRWLFGHCRVVAGVLTRCHGRWACLPMAQRNFTPLKEPLKKHKIHAGLQKKTIRRRKRERKARWTDTKGGIAAALVNGIRRLFQLPVLVVCDSWFGNHSLLKALREAAGLPDVHILSRLRVSCVLHAMPVTSAKRGRPRKYGERLAKLEELAASLRGGAETATIHIYGRQRQCVFSELTCVSKALKCVVKVVFIHRSNDRFFPLVTTDLDLTAEQMVEFYSARWKIESGFKELKHEIGAIDSQCRKASAVENHFNLCCLSMTLAWVYAIKQRKAPKRRHPKRHSTTFAFADIRRKLEVELGKQPHFQWGCPETVKQAAKLLRTAIFGRAA